MSYALEDAWEAEWVAKEKKPYNKLARWNGWNDE
jgi:hypothetical protein